MALKVYGVNATITIFVFVLYCIVSVVCCSWMLDSDVGY